MWGHGDRAGVYFSLSLFGSLNIQAEQTCSLKSCLILDKWSLSTFPAWLDCKMLQRGNKMCGDGFLGIVPDKAVNIKRNECHQPLWPGIWFYLTLLLWSLLAPSPGVWRMCGLTHVFGREILGLTYRFNTWGADSPLAMTFGTDPRPLSAFGGPTTVPRDLWSNIAQAMLQE